MLHAHQFEMRLIAGDMQVRSPPALQVPDTLEACRRACTCAAQCALRCQTPMEDRVVVFDALVTSTSATKPIPIARVGPLRRSTCGVVSGCAIPSISTPGTIVMKGPTVPETRKAGGFCPAFGSYFAACMSIQYTGFRQQVNSQQLRSYHRCNQQMYITSHENTCRRRNALPSAGKNTAERETPRIGGIAGDGAALTRSPRRSDA
jgi:hypothetical protein